jgi:hypothetical protein
LRGGNDFNPQMGPAEPWSCHTKRWKEEISGYTWVMQMS